MKYTIKGRSGYVAALVALLIVGFSAASSLARRIGIVEPRIRIERSGTASDPSQAARAARYLAATGAMRGEVATTSERLREASALASAGSWLAIGQKNGTSAGLLRKLEAMGLLPAGSSITGKGNVLATPFGELVFHYRNAPIGVEVLSVGRDKTSGPALIVRVAGGIPEAEGVKVWSSIGLDRVQLPQPFANESEVIGAAWQAMDLHAGR